MQSDRELLELAYKALMHGADLNADKDMLKRWNPLTDDGDALRLAVKLRLDLWHGSNMGGVKYCSAQRLWDVNDSMYYDDQVNHGGDPYAATRRAIVRAAAEIGKAIK